MLGDNFINVSGMLKEPLNLCHGFNTNGFHCAQILGNYYYKYDITFSS